MATKSHYNLIKNIILSIRTYIYTVKIY